MASEEIILLLKELEDTVSTEIIKTSELLKNDIPATSSALQNTVAVTYTELIQDKQCIESMLKLVNKANHIIDIIGYRAYEVRYNFYNKVDELENTMDKLQKSSLKEKMSTLEIIDIEEEIQKRSKKFVQDNKNIIDFLLKAQEQHEHCIEKLDQMLENMKRKLNNLELFLEISQLSHTDMKLDHKQMEDLKDVIVNFTQLQSKDWSLKISEHRSSAFQGRKVTLTKRGLLETSGITLSYSEVKKNRLLEGIDILSFDLETNITSENKSQPSNKSSLNDRHWSEDINYIKNNLGTPLTLALAEITTVQPKDPIHYLGHWLFKYRYNQENNERLIHELQILDAERSRLAELRWKKVIEQEVRDAIVGIITKAEQETYQRELERIRKEHEAEEENIDKALEEEARDKFDTYETGLAV